MDRIRIRGGRPLNGTIDISGAKNAALPLMIASLLTDERLTLRNVPRLADVNQLLRILRNHGVDMTVDGKRAGERRDLGETFHLPPRQSSTPRPLRARLADAGELLGAGAASRAGRASARVAARRLRHRHPPRRSAPRGMEQLGAEIDIEQGYVVASAPGGLRGNRIVFPKVSVGATHDALMAATLAKGDTVIENAAREPEIGDVAECLVKMGARIEGIGTSTLHVKGVAALKGADHRVLADRIETGTYAMAAAMTGGDVRLNGAAPSHLDALLSALRQAGMKVRAGDDSIHVSRNGNRLDPVIVETQPYPGFPTDLQAQLMALMTNADGYRRSAKRSSRTASCMCRSWRGSAPTFRFPAIPRKSAA